MQSKQDMPMPEKDNDVLENFGPYENKEPILKEQEIEKDQRNFVRKSLNTESFTREVLSEHIFKAELLASILLLFLKKVKFGE